MNDTFVYRIPPNKPKPIPKVIFSTCPRCHGSHTNLNARCPTCGMNTVDNAYTKREKK